ncbi:hypothetical protein [Clostridium sp.]|uniref:hypothetical protein n=1 Tax=Clostridium sp. TaxID=1506 RepID=UPI002FCC1837
MDAYDLLRIRLAKSGGNAEGRMVKGKLESLEKALIYSYQAETLSKDGVEFRALLNNNKLKMDYDDKIISTPFSNNLKVGDIFYWDRTRENWIVYLQQHSEDAYFRGFVRKAQHSIKWKNKFGKICEVAAAVRGPVETKIKGEFKKGLAFDVPNYTLSILVPNNDDTSSLVRYSKISIADKIWQVATSDAISEPGVIGLEIVEDYYNKDENHDILDKNDSIPDNGSDKVNVGLTVETSLDHVTDLQLGEFFKIWINVEKDGNYVEELVINTEVEVITGDVSYIGDMITPVGLDPILIRVSIPKAGFTKDFNINVVDADLPPASSYQIFGDDTVKSFGKSCYQAKHFLDGLEKEITNGSWGIVCNDPKLFTVVGNEVNELCVKWTVGKIGKLTIQYLVDNVIVDSKDIKVESLI